MADSYIGRYCCIAHDVKIVRYSHPISFVSMHPCFYSPSAQAGFSFTDTLKWDDDPKYDEKYSVKIGSDVWIGAHVRIMSGVEIGDGSVIASGSVVVKNVDAYTIVGGVPAKPLRKRFDDATIGFLLKDKWWEKDFGWIQKHAAQFLDIEQYKNIVIDSSVLPLR